MNKNYIKFGLIGILVVVGLFCLFPRAWAPVAHAGDSSSNDTGVANSASSHTLEATATEQNQQSLNKAMPLPSALSYSMERQNLIDKLKFEAKQGAVGYVALIGPMGQLIAYYTINGKVSSLNSYLTTTTQYQCQSWGSTGGDCPVLDSPDLDGSYGVNPEGVFFFTTSGKYVEWSGNYLFSDQPMSYVTTPVLVTSGK